MNAVLIVGAHAAESLRTVGRLLADRYRRHGIDLRSDRFGMRLQLVGETQDAETVEIDGDEEAFVARYRDREGRLLAALAANRPAEVTALRRELPLAA